LKEWDKNVYSSIFRRTEFPSFGGVDQFSKKIETGWFLARIETVTPQQAMEKGRGEE
jgi:hypothetical protein